MGPMGLGLGTDAAGMSNVANAVSKCDGSSIIKDPWAHRSVKMRCGSCMYFVIKATSPAAEDSQLFGRCRRHAPTMSGFPAVYGADWCGDHKLDEAKA